MRGNTDKENSKCGQFSCSVVPAPLSMVIEGCYMCGHYLRGNIHILIYISYIHLFPSDWETVLVSVLLKRYGSFIYFIYLFIHFIYLFNSLFTVGINDNQS